MTGPNLHPLDFQPLGEEEMLARARDFRAMIQRRRTVRDFQDRPVPRAIIEAAVMTAAGAPSGAISSSGASCAFRTRR